MHPSAQPAVSPGWAVALLLGLVALLSPSALVYAQEARDGLFITVPNPIDDKAVNQIERKIQEAIERQKRNISIVVFNFNPQGQPAGTSDWNSPNRLAEFIRNLQRGTVPGKNYPNIKTRAFVQNAVSKHTVLPVLACKQIYMADDSDPKTGQRKARLGDVVRESGGVIGDTARLAYAGVARNFASPDLVARMLDRGLVLKKVKTIEGPRYVSDKSLRELANSGQPFTVEQDLPDCLQLGNASFDARQGLEIGICAGVMNSAAELAAAFHLPRKSLTEDWLVIHDKVYPWRIEVRGPLDQGKLDALERRIKTAIGKGANLLMFQLEAEGGEVRHVASTAQMIRNLQDDNQLPVKTIAWVAPDRSLGAATFLALACNEIVMAPSAALADFSKIPADQIEDVKAMLLPLVKEQGYPALLFEATLSKDLALYRMKTNDGEDRLAGDNDWKNPGWRKISQVDRVPGQFLKITAPLAREFYIALDTDIASVDALHAYCRVDSQRVPHCPRRLA